MKLISITLFFLILIYNSYSQEPSTLEIFSEYELFLESKKKDTLIKYRYKEYKCSENFFGTVHFYYQNEKLKLIQHTYKQGFYNDYVLELYYIKNDSLALQSVRTRITHQNTVSYQNKYSRGTSVENVYELVEQRTVIGNKNLKQDCYIRGEGKEMSESEKLNFEKSECFESFEEIDDKYKFLLKVEKKFLRAFHKGPACIFHIW